MNIPLPELIEITQSYPASAQLDFHAILAEQFDIEGLRGRISPGMRIAVGVGSRGIANLKEIVQAALRVLIAAGAQPFVIPAMGSHGGATAEGQKQVLAEYGITEESIGVPIEASMDVEKIGTVFDGRDVVLSVPALRADGIVAINRVKPHTDFRGTLGSGIQKMLTIGFGKQVGAANMHRAAAHVGHEIAIHETAKTAQLKVLRPDAILDEEPVLLERARSLMPRLPLDEIDLLIVDQIGKEISGTGMDTNIIGRDIAGYSTSLRNSNGLTPHIARIFVRELSHATNGNGIGIGLADFTTDRAVKALDLRYMYINATTSIGLHPAKIPIHFATDREVIDEALGTLAAPDPETIRIVRIVNTLSLERILVSACYASMLEKRPGVTIGRQAHTIQFDAAGNLLPF